MLNSQTLPRFRTRDPRRRAFFVSYGAGHIAKIAPVVRELRRQGVECLLMALTIGYPKARQLGLEPMGYRDFLPLLGPRMEEALSWGDRLLVGNTHPEVDLEETRCYLGINFLQWVDAEGEVAARLRYQQRGRQGFMPVDFMGRVLDALQPGLVVATSTPRSEEAAIRSAVSRGIPTLTMVDLFAPESDPFLYRPVHARCITVIATEVRERFLAHGLASNQVFVTGSPDFDELFDPCAVEQGRALRAKLGWEGFHIVLWAGILEPDHATFPGAAFGLAVEQALRAWVKNTPQTGLIVRYHPAQYHEFARLAPQECVHLSIPRVDPIAPLLQAADTVIHQVSTVGLQAAVLGKRVLHLGFSAWVQSADFDLGSLGPSELVNSLDEIATMLNNRPAPAADRPVSVPQGPATPRIAELALQLLNSP
ncbi:hypothetical protein ATF69_2618 [Acidovorax delafieldii]|uniref:Capsular polysaccharide biosynthesis protein n=1 Tax=Acidovorax delafieldii TaxID=47920 RepID=A0A561XN90_ACIDE|nr:hypothetical protein [Acidovorax delafieldii]TWG37570.1 hypothetical protein ATF69_2618 [Acidovorax delafieldii]